MRAAVSSSIRKNWYAKFFFQRDELSFDGAGNRIELGD